MKGHLFPAFIVCSLLLVGSTAIANPAPNPPKAHLIITRSLEDDILQLVNKHRASLGLSQLTTDAVLIAEAEKHSRNMADRKVPFGHKGFADRMKSISSQVANVRSGAENVAHGDMTADEVVKAWLTSPEHKKNIEGSYRLTGIGISKDKKGGYYFTQIFAG